MTKFGWRDPRQLPIPNSRLPRLRAGVPRCASARLRTSVPGTSIRSREVLPKRAINTAREGGEIGSWSLAVDMFQKVVIGSPARHIGQSEAG